MQDEHTYSRNGPALSPTCLTCVTPSVKASECSSPFATTNFQNLACPGCVRLQWDKKPQTILIVKKQHDKRASQYMVKVIHYLISKQQCSILVEEADLNNAEDAILQECFKKFSNNISSYTEEVHTDSDASKFPYTRIEPSSFLTTTQKESNSSIDLVISLGGDGTVLHTVMKFCNKKVPPLIAFNLGTFNFLASFEIEQYEEYLNEVFNNNSFVSIRMRLKCTLGMSPAQAGCAASVPKQDQNGDEATINNNNETSDSNKVLEEYHVMNDIVIDRGPSPFLTRLDCYCCNTLITTVQADGLIIATPTGSTAYSMSAGGSIVHPIVPCLLFTPISPHSLSFRPLIFPGGTILNVTVPREARSDAWLSCDGQRRRELKRGEFVKVEMSEFPVPLICKSNETAEWFLNLTKCLGWNVRTIQRPL